jgi:hypothetical protein
MRSLGSSTTCQRGMATRASGPVLSGSGWLRWGRRRRGARTLRPVNPWLALRFHRRASRFYPTPGAAAQMAGPKGKGGFAHPVAHCPCWWWPWIRGTPRWICAAAVPLPLPLPRSPQWITRPLARGDATGHAATYYRVT